MHSDRWKAVACALGAVGLLLGPGAARAGLLPVTLAAGPPGSTAAADAHTFQFQAPASGLVVVYELAVGDTVTAATGGGTSFFGGAGVPVLLNLSDGGA